MPGWAGGGPREAEAVRSERWGRGGREWDAREKGLAPKRPNAGVTRWGEGLRVVRERAMGTVLEREGELGGEEGGLGYRGR